MKLAAAAVAVGVIAAPQAAGKGPTAPRAVFGIVMHGRETALVKLNALTLRPVSRRAVLASSASYLGRSPGNGGRVALRVGPSVRFVDVDTMRVEGRVGTPCAVSGPILWEDASRLVATCSSSASSVLVLDPVTRKVRARRALTGSLISSDAANGRLVGLLAPLDQIGPARLMLADGLGHVRTVELPGVRAGTEVVSTDPYRARIENPALAIHPGGQRAVVIPAAGPVTEVDLRTLSIAKHALVARQPASMQKAVEGTTRSAVWTWSNTIAVTGMDATVNGEQERWTPAGLTLIDPGGWTTRTLDNNAVFVTWTGPGGMLLGWGSIWDAVTRTTVGNGLTAYSGGGTKRFHLFGNESISVTGVAGTYAYIGSDNLTRFRVVDTTTGKVLRSVRTARPTLIWPMRSSF